MEGFRRLGVIAPILKAIEDMGITEPTEIQRKSIPAVLKGQNVIAGSATGSGKTLAFGCGLIQKAEKGKGVQALVLTPTRELAEQVFKELKKFAKYKPLGFALVYGGVGINPQIDALKKADIVVATPGRLLDHLQRRTVNLKNAATLVLDEADIMFDMGFIDDVEKIISQCARERQMMLFSATVTAYVDHVTKKYMRGGFKVSAESYVDTDKLVQIYYDVPENQKFSLLVHLLKHERSKLVMVFCNTKRNVDFVAKNLKLNGVQAMAIHGGFSQDKRSKTMEQFHAQDIRVLVCTDVAARGLDIKGISHVYNYDIPKEAKQYIHRIGRTARAGKNGRAINILAEFDHDNFSRVLRDFDVKIEKQVMPKVARIMVRKVQQTDRFGRGGQRGPPRRGQGQGARRGPPRRGSGQGPRTGQRRGPPRRTSGQGQRRGPPRRGQSQGQSQGQRQGQRHRSRESSGRRSAHHST
jgi:ATP-dependent RNA helicase DeaD